MSLGKASIMRAANAGTRKSAGKAANTVVQAEKSVAESVISPMNTEEIQVKFLSGNTSGQEDKQEGPVRITEKLPDYLL